ncbi:hypothetical protein F5884DRAFT_812326 [Xylogone sp. PMI_703]|nr:hypothetical protein F5884DRAFT_812326 [Xylogone sp. PMI_703]
MGLRGLTTVVVGLLSIARGTHAFNAPPGVLTWCGKAYEPTNASFNPGGQFKYPATQKDPLLDVTVRPRYTIFLESDGGGSFIVDAPISYTFGQTFTNITYTNTDGGKRALDSGPFTTIAVEIMVEDTGALLVSQNVAVNSTGTIFDFSFSGLKARLKPYQVALYGTSLDGYQTFSATTEIYILPDRTDGGSAVTIDNLYGGLYVQNKKNNWSGWYPVYPSNFYTDANYVFKSPDAMFQYQDYGMTSINLVPDDTTFNYNTLNEYWDIMDEINLLNMYDMRYTFTNITFVEEQVTMFHNRTSLLMWYTGDEPDGAGNALNSTKLSYKAIKKIDPYHPVSLVLNCADFYFKQYTAGTDIIMEDAYTVGINATWSKQFLTPCNATYGDCGCDECVGELEDVSNRLDLFATYQENLQAITKPLWAVLQGFGGDGYWATVPSEAEFLAMLILSINHNAKGLSSWWYPSSEPIQQIMGTIGKLMQTETILNFVFGTNPVTKLPVKNGPLLDVSAWTIGSQMMVGIVNGEYVASTKKVTITLPTAVKSIEQVAYGSSDWTVVDGTLQKKGLSGLEADILIVNI